MSGDYFLEALEVDLNKILSVLRDGQPRDIDELAAAIPSLSESAISWDCWYLVHRGDLYVTPDHRFAWVTQ